MPEQNESRPVGAPDGLQSSTNPAASVTDVTAIRHFVACHSVEVLS